MVKTIFFFTSSRSEYTLFKPLILKFINSKKYQIRIIVTGSHLQKKFGLTMNEILKDFNNKVIISKIKNNKSILIDHQFSEIILNTSKILKKNKVDMLFILGDRFESLAASIAAYLNNIKISHIHGGEVTEGSLDDGFRHSITKLSYLHFVSSNIYRKRVIQLGENPKNIFNVGSLGVELIIRNKKVNILKIEKKYKFKFFKKNILVTFHPNTLDPSKTLNELNQILKVVLNFKNILFIFTSSNADKFGNLVNLEIKKFIKKNKNTIFIESFGSNYFFSVLNKVDIMIGNSSSGILEAPYLGIYTINLGNRQKGRIFEKSIYTIKPLENQINHLIIKLINKKPKTLIDNKKNISMDTSNKIFNTINKIDFFKPFAKKFYDI